MEIACKPIKVTILTGTNISFTLKNELLVTSLTCIYPPVDVSF